MQYRERSKHSNTDPQRVSSLKNTLMLWNTGQLRCLDAYEIDTQVEKHLCRDYGRTIIFHTINNGTTVRLSVKYLALSFALPDTLSLSPTHQFVFDPGHRRGDALQPVSDRASFPIA